VPTSRRPSSSYVGSVARLCSDEDPNKKKPDHDRPGEAKPMNKVSWRRGAVVFVALAVSACAGLEVHDTQSLLLPSFQRSELVGLVAGFGTTFAAFPDLVAMLRRRSSAGMNPRMAGIMGVFQILWVYYGLLILSRPVVVWNIVAVLINFLSVGAYFYFRGKEEKART
jgi:uncharacterized protein with PQ loop repeat